MPFQKNKPHTTKNRQELTKIFLRRKEEDSFMTHKNPFNSLEWKERAYIFTSFKGSILIEASIVIPIFFLACCCLCFLLEVLSIQNHVEMASHYACKEMMKEYTISYPENNKKIEKSMVEAIGKERLDSSMIEGGSKGFDCSKTKIIPGTGIVKFHVTYKIRVPIFLFGKFGLSCEQNWKVKRWTGYVKESLTGLEKDMVYVTETGMVYHKDLNCPYLHPSIKRVRKSDIDFLRNKDGGKYYPCERCKKSTEEYVYITSYGTSYHSSVKCSGLKRKIYVVPLSETRGKGVCSKCGK